MNILHVISQLDPSTGGPPRVVTRLAAGQSQLGHQVTIATYALRDAWEDFRAMTRNLPTFERVRIVELERDGAMESVFASRSRPVLARLLDEADVLHLHNVWEAILRVAAEEARKRGKPYLLQPNDMLNPYSLKQKGLKKRVALMLGYRKMIEKAYALLFGHTEERRLVQEAEFKTQHLVTSLGGVFTQEVEPLPPAGLFYKRFPQLQGRPFVVFLSRLHHKKGLDYLAEGFAKFAVQVPDVQLVVIGHDEGAKADFERRIAGYGLQDRVHLVGPMHGEAKWEAYRDAACFILPSRDEAFTVAITEALAAGLPVVISSACHYDDVQEYGAGEIVELNADAIGMALKRVMSDAAARKKMSEAAKRLFSERLSFDRAALDACNIYAEAMAHS